MRSRRGGRRGRGMKRRKCLPGCKVESCTAKAGKDKKKEVKGYKCTGTPSAKKKEKKVKKGKKGRKGKKSKKSKKGRRYWRN